MATFRLSASVVNTVTERGLGTLRIEVWAEAQPRLPIGNARTDAGGEFNVLLQVPEPAEGPEDGPLELEFRVYDGEELLGTTREVVPSGALSRGETVDVRIRVAIEVESETQPPSGDVEERPPERVPGTGEAPPATEERSASPASHLMDLSEEARLFLEQSEQIRGYTLDMHRIMAAADFDWLKKYNEFIEATYTGQRTLDRKTKELLQVVVETALRADMEQIRAHVRLALDEGATPREILESLEAVIAPMGALAFRRGLQGWVAETGLEPG